METPLSKCPSCHAPLQPGATFCSQCGFDLPTEEPGTEPRPEKCPFCSAPVEGQELACRQCGFDFDREWQPENGDLDASGQNAKFDPKLVICRDCGQPNPSSESFCCKCNAPISSTVGLMPGTEGIWFGGYVNRRLVGPMGALPRYARITRIVIGAGTIVLAIGLIIGAIGMFCSDMEVGALLLLPVLVLNVWFGYLVMGGRKPSRFMDAEGTAAPCATPTPDDHEAEGRGGKAHT